MLDLQSLAGSSFMVPGRRQLLGGIATQVYIRRKGASQNTTPRRWRIRTSCLSLQYELRQSFIFRACSPSYDRVCFYLYCITLLQPRMLPREPMIITRKISGTLNHKVGQLREQEIQQNSKLPELVLRCPLAYRVLRCHSRPRKAIEVMHI